MKYQILISTECRNYGFSVSRTGQLDYAGVVSDSKTDINGWNRLESSTYFSPAYNIYLKQGLRKSPVIYVQPGTDISDKNLFSYILHVGMLLCAVDSGDSLLAGELYIRRRSCFDAFSPVTRFIIEEFSPEILFSLCFGRLDNIEPESIPLIYEAARVRMGLDSSKETPEQAFIRYFRESGDGIMPGRGLTLQIVGSDHYPWEAEPCELAKLLRGIAGVDFLKKAEQFREEKRRLYEGLNVSVQAEPYNPADKYAVSVSIDSIQAVLDGNPGLCKAGYIRAAAARILRKAFPDRMKFTASISRITPEDTIISLSI